MGDRSSDDSEDITCELNTIPVAADDEAALDWSISGISAASGFDPDRFHSLQSVASSVWNSPVKKTQKGISTEHSQASGVSLEFQKLAGSVRDLQLNLEGISQMSNSPRREKTARSTTVDSDEDTVKTPRNTSTTNSRPDSNWSKTIDTTPPVRDTGPSGDNSATVRKSSASTSSGPLTTSNVGKSKLDMMKDTLKELEEARARYIGSKIPRRSLSFNNSSATTTSSSSTKAGSYVSQVRKASRPVSESSSGRFETDSDRTVVENSRVSDDSLKKVVELQRKLSQEEQQKNTLEDEVSSLRSRLEKQEKELEQLQQLDNKKEQLLTDLKVKWAEVAGNWSNQLRRSHDEVERLKAENQAAKNQFFVCEEELSKALQLASEFKQRIDEEEQMKQDLLTQFLSERTLHNNQLQAEKEKNQQLSTMNNRLSDEIKRLRFDLENSEKSSSSLQLKLDNVLAERSRQQNDLSEWQKKSKLQGEKIEALEKELKTTQSSLHTFYVSQMESIMAEKVSSLQASVAEWEKSFNLEKQREMDDLKKQHAQEMARVEQEFRSKYMNQENTLEALEASLKAARREFNPSETPFQTQNHSNHSNASNIFRLNNNLHGSASTQSGAATAASGFQITTAADAGRGTRPSRRCSSSTTAVSSDEDQRPTRLVQRKPPAHRPLSAGVLINNLRPGNQNNVTVKSDSKRPQTAASFPPSQKSGASSVPETCKTDNRDTSMMTPDEKKEIVTAFIRQFLEDHPESVLDSSFLSSLNEMAMRLIQESFHEDGSGNGSSRNSPVMQLNRV